MAKHATVHQPEPGDREALEQRIRSLRSMRGLAAADGFKFDASELTAAENALAVHDDLIAELARRKIAAAQAGAEKVGRELRMAIDASNADRIRALREAETAFTAFVVAAKSYLDETTAMRKLMLAGKFAVPSALEAMEIENLLSRAMRTAMRPLIGRGDELGQLTFEGSLMFAVADWVAADMKISRATINQITEKE